jgi:SWI/SNF-related matrix-associated actin-dependent regulator of chromatin subfamily D
MYQDLLEMERKLDWTMMRKRVEVQDALGRIPSVRFFFVICIPTFILYGNVYSMLLLFLSQTTRTLRIFLSHTVSSQQWQNPGEIPPVANFETGEGIPAWAFKVEGRLLEVRV